MHGTEIVSYLFGGFITATGVVAALYHWRRWKQLGRQWRKSPPMELLFEVRQQRRRFQLAVLGGLGGLALTLAGFVLPRWPVAGVWLVVFAMAMVAWALLLAIGDMVSIQSFHRLMTKRQEAEQSRFAAEFRREHGLADDPNQPIESSDNS